MEEEDNRMDTNSNDDSSDDESSELEKRAEELEKYLSDNVYLYDTHVELVGIYKKLADLTSLRMAFERFQKTFPLTATLWLSWIRDEIAVATTDVEKKYVLSLFDAATEDYLSIELWLEYAQYSLGGYPKSETQSILEKALNAGGLHVSKGSLLWDTLRELEFTYLSLEEPNSENFNAQLLKVADIFKRQLSVPLLDMQNTYEEWKEFLSQFPEKGIDKTAAEWGYKQALKVLETYKPFEDRLLIAQSNEEIWDVYKEYIKSVKDPSVVLCLYERAVEKLCLNPEVWLDYCGYSFKFGGLKISDRAVRNVTWNEDLWILRLRILENLKESEEDVMKCFETGLVSLQSSVNLWLTYLDYMKRNNPDRLSKLFEQAETQLGPDVDTTFKIKRYHARIAAKNGDLDTARKLWNNIMHNQDIKQSAHYWLECINLEKRYGDVNHTRILLGRALTSCKDWPQSIAEEWMLFEREEGGLEDIMKCTEKIRKLLPAVVIQNVTKTDKPTTKRKHENIETVSVVKRKKLFENKSSFKDKSDFDSKLVRNQSAPIDLDPLKSMFLSNLNPTTTVADLSAVFPNGKITIATNNKGGSRCFGYVQFESEQEAEAALLRDREAIDGRPMFISRCKHERSERQAAFKFSSNLEKNKLFVRGLPIKHSKDDVEKMFKPYNCVDVRLVLHKSGQSKGIAYVDFANDTDAENALKATNQTKIGEFVITVAISAPPTKGLKTDDIQLNLGRPKNRLQMPLLVPRVLAKKSEKVETKPVVAKSNNDFRNMLLNKK